MRLRAIARWTGMQKSESISHPVTDSRAGQGRATGATFPGYRERARVTNTVAVGNVWKKKSRLSAVARVRAG